jgi:serine/threonine protein kinase
MTKVCLPEDELTADTVARADSAANFTIELEEEKSFD